MKQLLLLLFNPLSGIQSTFYYQRSNTTACGKKPQRIQGVKIHIFHLFLLCDARQLKLTLKVRLIQLQLSLAANQSRCCIQTSAFFALTLGYWEDKKHVCQWKGKLYMWGSKISQLADKVAFHCSLSSCDNFTARSKRSCVYSHISSILIVCVCVNRFKFSHQPKRGCVLETLRI